jgi:hypothetical protein
MSRQLAHSIERLNHHARCKTLKLIERPALLTAAA